MIVAEFIDNVQVLKDFVESYAKASRKAANKPRRTMHRRRR